MLCHFFGQVLFSLLNYFHIFNWFTALLDTNVKLLTSLFFLSSSIFIIKTLSSHVFFLGQVLFSLLNYFHLFNWFTALLATNVKLTIAQL
jgi:hypothetical protein